MTDKDITREFTGNAPDKMAKARWYLTMKQEIETICEEDIKQFAMRMLDDIPEYFFIVAASSSGKYHPETDLGPGGLVRHSINVKRMLEHLLVPDDFFPVSDRGRQLLKVAALFHDCMKSGTQEMYEKNEHTKFLHPIYANNFVTLKAAEYGFPYEDGQYIADVIASHMGQWNQKGNETMPKPASTAQKVLHLADYLASRKGIEMEVEEAHLLLEAATNVE